MSSVFTENATAEVAGATAAVEERAASSAVRAASAPDADGRPVRASLSIETPAERAAEEKFLSAFYGASLGARSDVATEGASEVVKVGAGMAGAVGTQRQDRKGKRMARFASVRDLVRNPANTNMHS